MEKNFELVLDIYFHKEQYNIYKLKKNNGKYKLNSEVKHTDYVDGLLGFLNASEPCRFLIDKFGIMAFKEAYESITKKKLQIEFESQAGYSAYVEKVISVCNHVAVETKEFFLDYIHKIYAYKDAKLYHNCSREMRELLFVQDKNTNKDIFQKYEKNLITNINVFVETYKKKSKLQTSALLYHFQSDDLLTILYAELKYSMRFISFYINQCQYCGDYFVPVSRSDEKFCYKIYEDGTTCKLLGVRNNWKNILEEDEVRKTYNNLYQKKLMYCKRNSDNHQAAKDFEEWKIFAKDLMKKYKKGEIDREKVMELLNK